MSGERRREMRERLAKRRAEEKPLYDRLAGDTTLTKLDGVTVESASGTQHELGFAHDGRLQLLIKTLHTDEMLAIITIEEPR